MLNTNRQMCKLKLSIPRFFVLMNLFYTMPYSIVPIITRQLIFIVWDTNIPG